MKKVLNFLFKGIMTLLLPAILVGLIFVALNQSFGVGLVILFFLFIIQFILGIKFKDQFGWSKHDSLSLVDCLEDMRWSKVLNILFNAVKIVTVLSALYFINLNYPFANPLNDTWLAIIIALTSIGLFILLFKKSYVFYRILRICFSIIILITFITFFYLYFGTQLLWLLFFLFLVITFLFNGFIELEKKLKDNDFLIISFCNVIFLLTAIISTIIQYWSGIQNFFYRFWTSTFSFKIANLSIVFWILGLIAIFVITVLIVKLVKKQRLRKEMKLKALKAQEKEEKAEKEQKEREEKEDKARKEKKEKLLSIIASIEKEGGYLFRDEIVFLSQNRNSIEINEKLISMFINHLFEPVQFDWKQLITISEVKKQLVWSYYLEYGLVWLDFLYNKSFKDEELEKILKSINGLYEIAYSYKEYRGFETLIQKLNLVTREIPDDLLKARKLV